MIQESISELKRGLHQIRSELRDIRQLLAARRRESEHRELKYQLAAARFETALIRYVRACQKAGFNPGQRRVPAGSREGGRWTADAGSSRIESENVPRVTVADASNALNSGVMSDATADPVNPGAQYAQTQINVDTSALTGISTIDETTKQLVTTLARVKDTVEFAPNLTPRAYGTAVHTAFAKAVRAQQLPGIKESDVETTFGGDYYGAEGSVRTDVILRNDVGDVIAIYDVKTGESGIEPIRAARLRLKVDVGNDVPIIQMSFRSGVTRKYATLRSVSCVQAHLYPGG